MILLLLIFCFLSPVGSVWADEAEQLQMLRAIFQAPRERWPDILKENRQLLDPTFFWRLERRLSWDRKEGYLVDARQFALVGDLALKEIGLASKYARQIEDYVNHGGLSRVGVTQALDLMEMPRPRPLVIRKAASLSEIREAKQAWKRGKLEAAERHFRAALVHDPKSVGAWLALADLHVQMKKPNLTTRELRQVVSLKPSDASAWLRLSAQLEAAFDERPEPDTWKSALEASYRAMRLQPGNLRIKNSLNRLRSKARNLRLDLNADGRWVLALPRYDVWEIGERYGSYTPTEEEMHATGSAAVMAGQSKLYPMSIRDEPPGPISDPPSFLNWDSPIVAGLWAGAHHGRLSWVRSLRGGTELEWEGILVGRTGGRLADWEVRLGESYCCFRDTQEARTVHLYRASLVDIGLEVEKKQVVGIILMEPGQLRINLQRFPRYREN